MVLNTDWDRSPVSLGYVPVLGSSRECNPLQPTCCPLPSPHLQALWGACFKSQPPAHAHPGRQQGGRLSPVGDPEGALPCLGPAHLSFCLPGR